MSKKINPDIILRLKDLFGTCIWYWSDFYDIFATCLNKKSEELENTYPKTNKFEVANSILSRLNHENNYDGLKNLINYFYNLSEPKDKGDNKNFEKGKKALEEFKKIVKPLIENQNKEDDTYNNIIKENIKNSNDRKDVENKIKDFYNQFIDYSGKDDITSKQKRGYFLEEIFYELLKLNNIDGNPSYKNKDEQIDGRFKFNSFDYIVEIKWTQEKVKKQEVDILLGKIKTKAESTRGCILSVNGFDDSAVNTAENGERKLFFIDSIELIGVLENRRTLYDLLYDKEQNLVAKGKCYK